MFLSLLELCLALDELLGKGRKTLCLKSVKSFENIPCVEFFSSVRRLNIPWAGGVRDELGIAAQG